MRLRALNYKRRSIMFSAWRLARANKNYRPPEIIVDLEQQIWQQVVALTESLEIILHGNSEEITVADILVKYRDIAISNTQLYWNAMYSTVFNPLRVYYDCIELGRGIYEGLGYIEKILTDENINVFELIPDIIKKQVAFNDVFNLTRPLLADSPSRKILILFMQDFSNRYNVLSKQTDDDSFDAQLKLILESCGPIITKFCQMLSTDKAHLALFPEKIQDLIIGMRSHQTGTFSKEDAQNNLSTQFGKNKYHVLGNEPIGVGALAETWRVQEIQSGRIFVSKMVKTTVSEESLEIQRSFIETMIKHLVSSQEQQKQYIAIVRALFVGWRRELDLKNDFDGSKKIKLLTGKRLKIPEAVSLSKNKKILIMDEARGISLDQLEVMFKFAFAKKDLIDSNPEGFMSSLREEFKKEFDRFPWLSNFLDLRKKIADLYIHAIFPIYTQIGGTWHGDLHPGNIIIDNHKGSFVVRLIDYGLTIHMAPKESVDIIFNYLFNWMIGNTEAIARLLINDSNVADSDKEKLIKDVAKDFRNELFNGKFDIKMNLDYMQTKINEILKKYNIYLRSKSALSKNSLIKYIHLYNNLFSLTDTEPNNAYVVGQILKMLMYAMKTDFVNFVTSYRPEKTYLVSKYLFIIITSSLKFFIIDPYRALWALFSHMQSSKTGEN